MEYSKLRNDNLSSILYPTKILFNSVQLMFNYEELKLIKIQIKYIQVNKYDFIR